MTNSTHHKKGGLGKKTVYNYKSTPTYGMDLSLLHRQGTGEKLACLDNLYRDKIAQREAVETFPGYRRLMKTLSRKEDSVNGLFCHEFDGVGYLFVHVGHYLYCFRHDKRDLEELLPTLSYVEDRPSRGVSLGNIFYFFDGSRILRFTSPDSFSPWGDEDYTEEMEELREFPKTDAYVPLLSNNGETKEERNLLTNYYRVEDMTGEHNRVYDDFGPTVRMITEGESPSLEVTGCTGDRRILYIPNTMRYRGKTLPVTAIASGAFRGMEMEWAIVSENVKRIGSSEDTLGAFESCPNLKNVYLYGAEVLHSNTFALCSALTELVIPTSLTLVAANAFYGTSSLKRVYYEGSGTLPYTFGSDIALYPNTALGTLSVGEDLRIAIDPDKYQTVYRMRESTDGVMSAFTRFGGWESGVYGDAVGYAAVARKPCCLYGICFDSHLQDVPNRYGFFTVVGEGEFITPSEDPFTTYRIPIPDRCRSLVSLEIGEPDASYTVEFADGESPSRVQSLLVHLPAPREVSVSVTAYGYPARSESVLRHHPSFSTDMMSALRGADCAAVYNGELYLSSPALPSLVFYSERPKADPTADHSFFANGVLYVGEGTVKGFLPLSDGLAVLKDSGIAIVRDHTLISEIAGISAVGESAVYHDRRFLLLKDGVYELKEAREYAYQNLTKLSSPIDAGVTSYENGRFALWEGYLVLLLGSVAYLIDPDRSYRENGMTLHPWYRLTDLGHTVGGREIFRHVERLPDGLSGEYHALGRPDEAKGDILTKTTDGVSLCYTLLDGKQYLVEGEGEITDADTVPFCYPASYGGVLYAVAEDGTLFAVNSDQRENGVIPNACYHYDNRRIPARAVTELADMGCDYLTKKILRKSLTVDMIPQPRSILRLLSEEPGEDTEPIAYLSFDSLSSPMATPEGIVLYKEAPYDPHRFFRKKRYILEAAGFRRPIALCSLAFRYTVLSRLIR